MFLTPVLLESLERRFGLTWLSGGGDQINVRCPYCHKRGLSPDESGHLGINVRINKAHCVKCGWGHGNASSWLENFGVHLTVSFTDVIDDLANLKTIFETKKVRFDSSVTPLPKEFELIGSESNYFTESLSNKGISRELMLKNKIGFCESGKYDGYVIFPFLEDGERVYFQGRAAYPELLSNPKTKKKNPDSSNGMGKNSWLYGVDRVEKGCRIALVEGTLDQISLQDHFDRLHNGYFGVSLQGTTLSFPSPDRHPLNSQWGKIKYFEPEEVLVVFDPDAYHKAKELANILCRTGLNARAVRLFDGDPNEIMRMPNGDEILKRAISGGSEFDEITQTLSHLLAP
jgi:hypothetical protein